MLIPLLEKQIWEWDLLGLNGWFLLWTTFNQIRNFEPYAAKPALLTVMENIFHLNCSLRRKVMAPEACPKDFYQHNTQRVACSKLLNIEMCDGVVYPIYNLWQLEIFTSSFTCCLWHRFSIVAASFLWHKVATGWRRKWTGQENTTPFLGLRVIKQIDNCFTISVQYCNSVYIVHI